MEGTFVEDGFAEDSIGLKFMGVFDLKRKITLINSIEFSIKTGQKFRKDV